MKTEMRRKLKCGYTMEVTYFIKKHRPSGDESYWEVDVFSTTGSRIVNVEVAYRSDLRKIGNMLIKAADTLGK